MLPADTGSRPHEDESHRGASSSPLSSAISDASTHHDIQSQVDTRLEQYQGGPTDHTVALLRAILKHLPREGQKNLMDDILKGEDDAGLAQLGHHFVTSILVPCEY